MLDRKYLLENSDAVAANCRRRGAACDIPRIVELEEQRKKLLADSQEFNRQANEVSNKIKSAKDNDQRQQFIAEGRSLREQKDAAQKRHDEIDAEVADLLATVPNMTHPDVPDGGEEDAQELGFGKTKVPTFDFKPKDHLDLAEPLDLVDFEAGARVTGSGFYFLKNEAVLLDLALQQFALSQLIRKGFVPVTTPDLATTSVLQGIGFTPRGPETQIYSIE
ncbi:MAG: serine--tRNA ligase, partial [Pirellulaceae bacterium]